MDHRKGNKPKKGMGHKSTVRDIENKRSKYKAINVFMYIYYGFGLCHPPPSPFYFLSETALLIHIMANPHFQSPPIKMEVSFYLKYHMLLSRLLQHIPADSCGRLDCSIDFQNLEPTNAPAPASI